MSLDLTGKKIGMLQVLELVTAKPYHKKKYLCQCDCGNMCTRLHITLIKEDKMHSCGCDGYKYLVPGSRELCKKAGHVRGKLNKDGLNLLMTLREGTITTNTSGCQGVSWSGTAHKWHVYIGYQSYRANLGYYENMDDAVLVRRQAEEAIKNNTFEDFFYELRGHHLGDKESKYFKERNN